MPMNRRRFHPKIFAAFALLTLGGCQVATIDQRGYVPNAEDMERVKPGLQGKDEIREILGTPSSISAFNDDRWYYISKKTSTTAFFTPTVLDQKVVVVEFDDTGLVKDIRNYKLEDGQMIDPVTRKTPAPGRELGFMEQLIGNFGRFNSDKQSKQ
jgi:outer membrane protein assembly factor BamE (lipoprotein component of BamABCDE complex)